jgi:hypothetical protein
MADPFRTAAADRLGAILSELEPCRPLFLASHYRQDSRISAAHAIPFAVNFLQKQQKQREWRLATATGGSWPSGLRDGLGWKSRAKPSVM